MPSLGFRGDEPGLVPAVYPRCHAHNPDFLDCVIELFDAAYADDVADQARRDDVVVRVMWLCTPVLSHDATRGLLVVQVEDAKPGAAMAVDHWILMDRDPTQGWQRRAIPAALRSRLYLDDETAGGPTTD